MENNLEEEGNPRFQRAAEERDAHNKKARSTKAEEGQAVIGHAPVLYDGYMCGVLCDSTVLRAQSDYSTFACYVGEYRRETIHDTAYIHIHVYVCIQCHDCAASCV